MARTFQIISPDRTISLINTGATGIIAEREGFGDVKLAPHQFDEGRDIDDLVVTERWKLNLRGSSHDDLATTARQFFEVLREAWKYHQNPRDTQPIYLKAQTTGETNPRYALVYMSQEVSQPDFFAPPFDPGSLVEGGSVSIARFAWEAGIPGDVPASATTLDTAPDGGPSSPTIVPIVNTEEVVTAITHIYRDDGGAFSGNLFATASHDYFPSTPAVGDIYYVGSTTGPLTSVVFNVAQQQVGGTLTGVWEYWNGAWVSAPWATKTIACRYPHWYKYAGEHILGFHMEDWVNTTINGANAWWVRYRLTSASSVTTMPENGVFAPYACGRNFISIPDANIKGDISPNVLINILAPWSEVTANPDLGTVHRILVGAKSRHLSTFYSVINLHSGAVGNWVSTLGTDASNVISSDSEGSRARYTNVTFATVESMTMRIRMSLTGGTEDYQGEYKMFLRCQQIGGAVGDCEISTTTRLGAPTSVLWPSVTSEVKALRAKDAGPEIVDLGTLQVPFSPQPGDLNDTTWLAQMDLSFNVNASRDSTSSAVLRLYDIILIPIDEWTVEYIDPLNDLTYGSSSLRRFGGLLDDSGIIANGTWRYDTITGDYEFWSIREQWIRGGKPPELDPVRGQRSGGCLPWYNFI
jgi:hypothetical protein